MTVTRTSIPKPDVKVTITPQTVSPTVATPALPLVVVGACYFTLDPQLSTGLVANPDAVVSLPAMIRSFGQAAPMTVAADTVFTLNIDGTTVAHTFVVAGPVGPTYTLAQIVAALNTDIAAASASAVAETVGTGAATRFILRTTGTGAGQFIILSVTSTTPANAKIAIDFLKLPSYLRMDGLSSYAQTRQVFQYDQYPDPMNIISELDIDPATVRVFGNLSGGLSEWLKTSTVERCGSCSITYLDDGDADGYTNLAVFSAVVGTGDSMTGLGAIDADANLIVFNSAATRAAYTEGNCTDPVGVSSTLYLGINGLQEQAIDISAADTPAAVVAKIILRFPTIVSHAGGAAPLVFDLANLDAALQTGLHFLGRESCISMRGSVGGGGLMPALFGAGRVSTVKRGTWHPLQVGASLYVDGAFIGNVVEILPPSTVKLDREFPEKVATPSKFYFVQNNVPLSLIGTATWPAPDLYVSAGTGETEGTTQIKPEILRDSLDGTPMVPPLKVWTLAGVGTPVSGVACDEIIGYTGLRLDVTPSALNPDLIEYSAPSDLAAALAPIDTTNPLGLGMYYGLLNAPGMTVYGLGVDEVSATEPEGTLTAFTDCAEFLEAFEIYSIAPLTHDEDVAFMFQVHVDAMSDPDAKQERILWWNPSMPTYERDTIGASGAKGNKAGLGSLTFKTGLPDLPARLTAAGLVPGTVVTTTVFLQVAAYGSLKFAVIGVTGPDLTIAAYTGTTCPFVAAGTDFTAFGLAVMIDEPFTVGGQGASLYDTNGKYKKPEVSEAIYDLGQEFADRRVRMLIPDQVVATIGGLEMAIEGYYACCCLGAMRSYYPASRPFTNTRIGGLDRVQGTQGLFKESQLDLMAGGGAWILIPGPGGGGILTRMALTTDTSTIQYRQDTWTSTLDYASKLTRTMMRRIIGSINITPDCFDLIATIFHSCANVLTEGSSPIMQKWTLNSIAQDTVNTDSVNLGVSAGVWSVLDYININVTV